MSRGCGVEAVLETMARAGLVVARPMEVGGATPGQLWKLKRNLVIYIASTHGATQRLLADVFDLPHSRISVIVNEMKLRYGPNQAGSIGWIDPARRVEVDGPDGVEAEGRRGHDRRLPGGRHASFRGVPPTSPVAGGGRE